MADSVSHCCSHTDRGEVHNDVGEVEHRSGQRFGKTQHRLAVIVRHLRESDAKQNRKNGDLQDLIFGDGLGEIFGERVHNKFVPPQSANALHWLLFERGRQDQPHTGTSQVDCRDPNEQRDRCDHLEVDEALETNAAYLAHIAVAGNTGDESAKNKGRHDHFDQAEKNIA